VRRESPVSRRGLDRETVVATAARMADESGGDVTFAALAAHFKVRPPSLYNHVAGQEGLRRELALFGIRELGERITQAAVGRSGADAVTEIAHAYRRFALDRPGLYAASLRAPAPDDTELTAASDAIVNVLVRIMAAWDLHRDDAIHAIRGLRALMHGFASLETAGGFGIPLDLDESYDRAVRAVIAGLERREPAATEAC
jgi:AcrR family transcriptional regulator